MQDIENNMDELFRKAAADYPLNIGENKWDDIAPGLAGQEIISSAALKKSNNKKYASLFFLLMFFLIVGGILIKNNLYYNRSAGVKNLTPANELNNTASTPEHLNREVSAIPDKQSRKIKAEYKTNFISDQSLQKGNEIALIVKRNNLIKPVISSIKSNIEKYLQEPVIVDEEKNKIAETIFNMKSYSENAETKQKDNIIIPLNSVLNDTVSDNKGEKNNVQGSAKNNINRSKKQHSIYIGFVSGPAFNEVKNQGLKKTGFDLGIIAGYKFNNRSSVETGLMFAKKYYYSDGKYFLMNKMPAGMQVLSLEGRSTVFEIPVKFRYSLPSKKATYFFSSVGISSYLLTGEKNKYRTLINGAEQNITSTYKNNHGYIAATFDFSLGFEKKLGKMSSIRIEPYLKIPLKGIGVGSMPVMSTGLHVGIVRQSH